MRFTRGRTRALATIAVACTLGPVLAGKNESSFDIIYHGKLRSLDEHSGQPLRYRPQG